MPISTTGYGECSMHSFHPAAQVADEKVRAGVEIVSKKYSF